MRNRYRSILSGLLITAVLFSLSTAAQAADYDFFTGDAPEYYGSTSYEDIYGSQYNYGGSNLVDYQVPALEYLEPTSDNRITLITCVAGDYSVRWCVQAVER